MSLLPILGELAILSSAAWALELWQHQSAPLHLARQAGSRRSFTSADGLFCAEAGPRTAEGALALKSSGPHGALFAASQTKGEACAGSGYRVPGGEDACYPRLMTFFRSEEDLRAFEAAESAALSAFAARYALTEATAALMAACACHPDSARMASAGSRCASFESTPAAWVHHDPANNKELMCDEGPFQHATYAMATLKSSKQLPMHLHDQIIPLNCSSLGFPVLYPPADHCFPKMHIWTRTQIQVDEGVHESQRVEQELFDGGFERWAKERRLNTDVFESQPGCHCLPHSEVAMPIGMTCELSQMHPPIRDWWIS